MIYIYFMVQIYGEIFTTIITYVTNSKSWLKFNKHESAVFLAWKDAFDRLTYSFY